MDRLVGYYGPYATSRVALDADHPLQREIQSAARLLTAHISQRRAGKCVADLWPPEPRPK